MTLHTRIFIAAGPMALLIATASVQQDRSAGVPVIPSPASVVDGATLQASRGIGSNAWVTIFGSNLAPQTRGWASADFVNGIAPTVLEGVSVSINGRAAFIAFMMRGADFGLSYDQLNVLSPSDSTTGTVPVVVKTPAGASAPVMVPKTALAPAFFPFEPAQRRYAAASTGDAAEYIGGLSLFGSASLDRPVRPARISEVVTLYGSGFGPVDPQVRDGAIPGAAARLTRPVTVRVGGVEATVEYAGVAPSLAGIYQMNIRVPALAAGEHEIVADVDGVSTPSGIFLIVADVPYATFFHSDFSDFKLTGAHVFADCTSCHIRSRFAGTPRACAACHLDRYESTTAPNHAALAYPNDCSGCHVTSSFRGGAGHKNSRFALDGAHAKVACESCHTNSQYTGLDSSCAGCHLPRYQAAPNHVAGGYPTNCAACHTTSAFTGATFDHSRARVPLTGAHSTLQCSACHVNQQYSGTPFQCAACHQARYDATTSPDHAAAGFPNECAVCHTTAGWPGARIAHTRFALNGAHVAAECSSCHVNGRYAGTPANCDSCHVDRYNATTNPNHRAAGFPLDCSLCHSTTQFPGGRFAHTRFALTGAHTSVACSSCHANGIYAGRSQECSSCHLARYNATTNPNHASAGFPTTCTTCHTTSGWAGASFNHTNFALTGRHTTAACASCHVNGRYSGTPQDCASCHIARYNATTNPNHSALAFPTTCTNCHTTSGWPGATFSHRFPIYSGTHRGRWTTCSACHTNAANFAVFSCTGCHGKASTDSHHGSVTGYVYDSANCYRCHPTGSE